MAGAAVSVVARRAVAGVAVVALVAVVTGAAPASRAAAFAPGDVVTTATVSAATAASAAGIARADADWILSARLASGAIEWYPGAGFVSPYHAGYAAIGLAAATSATGDPRYVAAAWDWLDWYAAHQDASTGYVTNYRVAGDVATSTGEADSTDAYAGTFLAAVAAAYTASRDVARLRALSGAVSLAVGAIESTQDADGMTWAKPSWHVKYLMDQAEAYGGLRAAARVAAWLGDEVLSERATGDASAMAAGVARLWDGRDAYDWAVHADGSRAATQWSTLYEDAMEQAWTVAFGIASAARAGVVLDRLASAQPAWDRPGDGVGYWPVAGWGLLRAGRLVAAATAAARIRSAAVATGRVWPFTTGVAGQLLVLESGRIGLLGLGFYQPTVPAMLAE